MSPANRTYASVLQDLYSLQKYGIKFGLSQTANLLSGLGDPHLGRSFIHVGGSNGKGSVACLLESALRSCGYRTGLFTSPHLVHFNERFRISGQPIPPGETVRLYEELREAMDEREPPTFFEAVTAMALACFQKQDTDIDIIEVGMGGRLDATNLITPLVSIITNISLEHREFLGDTLLEVAGEKAGIIKEQVPLLTAVTDPDVLDLLLRTCRRGNAPIYRLDRDFHHRDQGRGLSFRGRHLALENVRVGLRGRHQRHNAALALAALDILQGQGWSLSGEGMSQGFARASWPGRLHQVCDSPRVVVDGAHNPAAMEELARSIPEEFDYSRLIVVTGIMEDKDAPAMLGAILPLADHLLFTRPEYPRAMEPSTLCLRSPAPLPQHEIVPSLPRALERAKAVAGTEDLVLVCGSLFTVGEALSHLDPEAYPPES
ncbi:MAG: bifunctional folylpolyglutamate synthase/dihydrofolate synthase [Desulfohalobiaceae bacterium]|nr:bifunctional folylpolyglutamate synthase/dihydrofolate synthase [Desulfohalobiaceae bacterium]